MGGFGIRSRDVLRAASALLLLVACTGKSSTDRIGNDGPSGSPAGGSDDAGGSAGSMGGSLGGDRSAPSGAGGISPGGHAASSGSSGSSGTSGEGGGGRGSSGIAGEGDTAGAGSSGRAGEGGLLAMAGSGAGAGVGGFSPPPCQPWPTPNNDPACPDPGTLGASDSYYASPCTGELSCDFLKFTGDPCYQPPRLVSFKCCGWGFATDMCPTLPEGQDPRCVLPVGFSAACTVEGLTCRAVVYENGSPMDFVCCNGFYVSGTSC